MAARLGSVFWGLLLAYLDLRIDDLDLLPDGLGYFLVVLGCVGMHRASARFSFAGLLAFLLIGVWFVSWYVTESVALELVETILDCALLWNLMGGIMELALRRNRPDLSAIAERRRVHYVGVQAVLLALSVIAGVSGGFPGLDLLAVSAVLASLTILFLVLQVIYRMQNELQAQPA